MTSHWCLVFNMFDERTCFFIIFFNIMVFFKISFMNADLNLYLSFGKGFLSYSMGRKKIVVNLSAL